MFPNLFITYVINKFLISFSCCGIKWLEGNMFDNEYDFANDIKLLREMENMTQEALAKELGICFATINRWETGECDICADSIEKVYSYIYSNGISLNTIKEQLYAEEKSRDEVLLFHGSKSGIEGDVSVNVSRANNDFGQGFYCGEAYRQAALFVSSYQDPSIYMMYFDPKGLKKAEYGVNTEWLLTIASYRGKIPEDRSMSLIAKAEDADYIIAPIADNRMFVIIDSFINGEITDEQCIHCLAATHLGMQYIMKTDEAISRVKMLERIYICNKEKAKYQSDRAKDLKNSDDKVRAVRIKYRGKGKYIDELI